MQHTATMNGWIEYWRELNQYTLPDEDFNMGECMSIFFGLESEYEPYQELINLI